MTTGSERRSCRSCGAPLVFVASETTGKLMPLDAEPNEAGNVILVGNPPRARVLPRDATFPAETRYASHFQTCPDAASWRRS